MKVREFPVFTPVALAGLAGKMPATITDRAITLHMRRRAPDEHVADFRERDARAEAEPLRDNIEKWVAANLDMLTAARPVMPEGVRDRPAEVWEALLAVADIAGGQWPEMARNACRHFVLGASDELSFGTRLLRDVRKVFGDLDRMFSADVVAALTRDLESEWTDLWGKPLDQRRLAKELKRYGIESQEVRIGAVNRKGYVVAGDSGLAQAWRRYLPPVGVRDKRDMGDSAGQSVADASRTEGERDRSATTETPPELQLPKDVADVADVARRDESRGDEHRVSDVYCRHCGDPLPEHMHAARRRGTCTRCTAKSNSERQCAS